LDALEAERREVDAPQTTSLDRRIAKQAFGGTGDGTFALKLLSAPNSFTQRARRHFLFGRAADVNDDVPIRRAEA
jgi:hypothetical protein